MNHLSYTLFLDDLREPTWDLMEVMPALTVSAAQDIVREFGLPFCLSLDHDLGKDEPSAMEFLHWLIQQHLDGHVNLSYIDTVIIHSANPVGAENLAALWDGFAKHIGSDVRASKRPRT